MNIRSKAKKENSAPQEDKLDRVTLLRAAGKRARPLRKEYRQKRDKTWNKPKFKAGTFFSCESVPVGTIQDLCALLVDLQNNPYACIIRGKLAKHQAPDSVRRTGSKNNKNEGFFDDVDRRWVQIDIDEGQLPFEVEPKNSNALEIAASWVRDEFLAEQAPELKDTKCVAQWSASAFLKDSTTIKLHLWFLFDRLVCTPSLRKWLKEIGGDPAQAGEVQPHYTCNATFSDHKGRPLKDHLVWRTRLLSGSFSEVKTPLRLLNSKDYGAALEEEREREQALQKERVKEAQQIGITEFSQDRASTYLSNAIDEILHAPKGTRHNTVFGQSYWIGRVVGGDNGLDCYTAQLGIEGAVQSLFASEPSSLATELKTVKDGLEQGQKEPYYTKRTPQTETKKEPCLQPITSSFSSLETLRPCLGDEVTLALSKTGTTVLVAPTGTGKTTYAINTLVEQCQGKKILWACYSKQERDRVARLLRECGLFPYVAEGRDYKNCVSLDNYLYASTLDRTCGAQWCKQVCPNNRSHPGKTGACRPPSPPKDAKIVVCTHALAMPTTSHFEPNVLVWDEGAVSTPLEADYAAIGRAVGMGEIGGETKDRLLGLLAESRGRKISASDIQEVIAGLEIEPDEERRDGFFSNLCREGSRPENETAINWRFLEALQICKDNEGIGAYIYNGILKLPRQPPVPDAPTRLILDATATKLASLATYGPHEWRCLALTPSEHTTHIHINCNGGKSTRRRDGSWEVQRTKRLHDALSQAFPGALHVEFKDWIEQEQDDRENTYYGSTEAKGSNKWSDRAAVIAWDNYVPKEEKDALVLSWIEGLKMQELEPDLKQLQKEAVWQFEVAPMMQAAGRTRPYAATKENPKTIITIGQKKRVPDLGKVTKSIEWDDALFELTGDITRRVASKLLPKLATKLGGLWYQDLQVAETFTLFNEISNGSTEGTSPIVYKGFTPQLTHPRFHWEKWASLLSDVWHDLPPRSMLEVVPLAKSKKSLRFLAPSPKDFSGIEERAKKEGWIGWTVFDPNGAELKRVDRVEFALSRLPLKAQFWNVGKILEWVSKESNCSLATAKRRMSKTGGVDAIRQKLSSQPPQTKSVISKLKPKKEPTHTLQLVQVTKKPVIPPKSAPKIQAKKSWPPPIKREPLPQAPTISCAPKRLLEVAREKGYPRIVVGIGEIERGRQNWLEYLELYSEFPPILKMVALALCGV